MATVESRVYNAAGVLIEVSQIEVVDTPETGGPNLPEIADQLARLTGVVDDLILASLDSGSF